MIIYFIKFVPECGSIVFDFNADFPLVSFINFVLFTIVLSIFDFNDFEHNSHRCSVNLLFNASIYVISTSCGMQSASGLDQRFFTTASSEQI